MPGPTANDLTLDDIAIGSIQARIPSHVGGETCLSPSPSIPLSAVLLPQFLQPCYDPARRIGNGTQQILRITFSDLDRVPFLFRPLLYDGPILVECLIRL